MDQGKEIRIGPIPLAPFIVMCLFGPFTIMTIIFIVWQYMVKPCQQGKKQDEEALLAKQNREDAAKQIHGFLGDLRPPPKVRYAR